MQLHGYAETDLPPEQIESRKLAEVTLSATPMELRRIAKFLSECASEMEHMGVVYDHVHLSDRIKEFRSSPHFVVCRSSKL